MQLRVEAPKEMAVFLAVEHPAGLPAIIVDVASKDLPPGWEMPHVKGLSVIRQPASGDRVQVAIVAAQASFWEPFVALSDDLLERVAGAASVVAALAVIRGRLAMWAHFFDRAPTGRLEWSERLGLIGELYALDRYLLRAAGEAAIAGWQGPERGPHDFILGSRAIEVKCTCAQQPVRLAISSARQLDSEGFAALYLFGVWLVEGPAGMVSLPNLVEALRSRVSHEFASVIGRFEDLLIQAGYLDAHREFYGRERFNVKGAEFFSVLVSFREFSRGPCL